MAQIVQGDCVEEMAKMPPDSVDSVVCDPPYGLNFMGKKFDQLGESKAMQVWHEQWAREALRVLKPGGYLLAFGGTRTVHRLTCAIEDAGFEIRDCIQWIYGSGFPKSHNISKAIDKMATDAAKQWDGWGSALKPAYEPVVVARKPLSEKNLALNVLEHGCGGLNIDECRVGTSEKLSQGASNLGYHGVDKPVKTEQHNAGRFPSNLLLSHAPGCWRVGSKRVKTHWSQPTNGGRPDGNGIYNKAMPRGSGQDIGYADPDGYEEVAAWECVEGCPVKALDEQSGVRASGSRAAGVRKGMGYHGANGDGGESIEGSEGGASRFFQQFPSEDQRSINEREVCVDRPSVEDNAIGSNTATDMRKVQNNADSVSLELETESGFFYTPKASRRERNAGLEGMPAKSPYEHEHRKAFNIEHRLDGSKRELTQHSNSHPTVKPIALMSYLIKLVTQPGGTVLDPFAGSGSTLVAAIEGGFGAIGIEREKEYCAIAEKRIKWATAQVDRPELPCSLSVPRENGKNGTGLQDSLFHGSVSSDKG